MAFEMIPVGTELFAKISKKHDTGTRMMVMLPGLWRRSKIYGYEASTATSFAFDNFYTGDHTWYRMERSQNGRYVACVRVNEDGSSGTPYCISKDLILRTWEEELKLRHERRVREEELERREKDAQAVFRGRLIAVAQAVLGMNAAKSVAAVDYLEKHRHSEIWRTQGISVNHYSHRIEFDGQALGTLMQMIEAASQGTVKVASESLLDKMRSERDEWRRRAETSEERLAAIRFMLQQQ